MTCLSSQLFVSLTSLSLVLQTQDLQVVCYAFTAFGKSVIKQKKLHPDTFIQLAMQLAFYRIHKRYGPGYKYAQVVLTVERY